MGCISVSQVSVEINDGAATTVVADSGNCNYLIPEGESQTIFMVKVQPEDKVVFSAIVDQNWSISEDPTNVSPQTFANDPQSYFVKLRQDDVTDLTNYDARLKASKVFTIDVSEYLPIALQLG